MSEWAPKRFWQDVSVHESEDGFAIRLDQRPVRSPGKRLLSVPTLLMAERIADEWRAQEDRIDPRTMPWTRSANSAIDKVALEKAAVAAHLTDYAGTDLLCYRDDAEGELFTRQATAWDPHLDWLERRHGVRLAVTKGVMPVQQPQELLCGLGALVSQQTHFQMTGFYDLVALSGSFVLGLAVAENVVKPETAWTHSRIDEDYQSEVWGKDEEAAEVANLKKVEFLHAAAFFAASTISGA